MSRINIASAKFAELADKALRENKDQPLEICTFGSFLKKHWPGWKNEVRKYVSLKDVVHQVLVIEYEGFTMYTKNHRTFIAIAPVSPSKPIKVKRKRSKRTKKAVTTTPEDNPLKVPELLVHILSFCNHPVTLALAKLVNHDFYEASTEVCFNNARQLARIVIPKARLETLKNKNPTALYSGLLALAAKFGTRTPEGELECHNGFRSLINEDLWGNFCCAGCNRWWGSGYAYLDDYQICKGCKEKVYPYSFRNKIPGAGLVLSKPHQVELCGACKRGVCVRYL